MSVQGSLGLIPHLNIGGLVFTDLTNLIVLSGSVSTSSNGATVRKLGTQTGYTPSGSNKFDVWGVRMVCKPDDTTVNCRMYYADNDVGMNSATAPTNPVGPATASATGDSPILVMNSAIGTDAAMEVALIRFQVPNGKFLHFRVDAGAITGVIFLVYGYEVA